jgi:hypothetical protein
MTKGGEFRPGHDQKTIAAIVNKVGGVPELRKLVEETLRCRIKVDTD